MSFSTFERQLMCRLIRLAEGARGLTFPNPLVGAAIYLGPDILGIGVHRRAGDSHAEVLALAQAGVRAKGAILMVTLEPCTHTGRTGPCVEAIIKSGISRVIYAVEDLNPEVRASPARAILQRAGIEVCSGLCVEEAKRLNRVYLKNRAHFLPWVMLKVGMSLDKKVAKSRGLGGYITGEKSLRQVHRFRREVQAIIVGAGTVRIDDPQLTIRYGLDRGYAHPIRVVLDPSGTLSLSYRVFEPTAKVIWCVRPNAEAFLGCLPPHIERVSIPHADSHRVAWDGLLSMLFVRGISSVMIESGPSVMESAIRSGCVDEIQMFIAPVVLGERAIDWGGVIEGSEWEAEKEIRIGEDRWVEYFRKIE